MAAAAQPKIATSSLPALRALQWFAVAVLAAAGGYFLLSNVLRYLDVTEATYRRYWPYRGWLMVHIVAGSVALLAGPLQFWTGLRRWNATVHRWIGRFYVAAVAVGAVAATYMGLVSRFRVFGLSLIAMALAWSTTTLLAFVAIRNRQVQAHKEWMIRSYVVSYGFVTFRLISQSGLLRGLGVEGLALNAWICWTLPLLFTEVVLQWRNIFGRRTMPTAPHPVSSRES